MDAFATNAPYSPSETIVQAAELAAPDWKLCARKRKKKITGSAIVKNIDRLLRRIRINSIRSSVALKPPYFGTVRSSAMCPGAAGSGLVGSGVVGSGVSAAMALMLGLRRLCRSGHRRSAP